MVLNPFLNLLCQRLECRNIGGPNIGVSRGFSMYMYMYIYINRSKNLAYSVWWPIFPPIWHFQPHVLYYYGSLVILFFIHAKITTVTFCTLFVH